MASSSSSSPELPVSRSAHANSSLHIDKNLRQVLEDLSSRFILNLPEVELASLERVCFQVEQAHWYYEDFVREQDPSFPTMTLKKFSNSLFHVCPLLSHWGDDHEQTFQSFLAYKTRVPVCGAIMLNEARDKCVLVKGWKATSAWSFPKGKINEQEPRHKCAVREVLEETGYDLSDQINPADVVELSIRDQSLSLYIVPNVPEDFPFETRTRKEISKISWFKLTDLPTWKRNKTVPGKFYLITPFIGPLKAFLRDHKPNNRRTRRRQNERNGSEQPASSEEEGHFDADGEDPAATAQESSSQASSADHGDPQTPSPLYSEPMVHATNGADDTGIQQPINMESLDPHVARLLTSLTLSASGTATTDVASKTLPTAAPPIPIKASGDTPASRSPSQTGTVRPSQPSRPSSVIPATSPPNSHRRHMSQNCISSPPRPGPFMGSNAINTPNRVASTSPVARRTAVANISPYLSRASATPAIPKQMKYLTMLENVAKESERMTPKLERQALGSGNISSASSGSLYGLREESPVIYSSSSGLFNPTLPANPQPYPAVNPISSAPINDPFTVRPHTSNTFHPHYQPNLHRPSLNEDQLRGVMPADAGRPPIGQPIGFHPAMPSNRAPVPLHPPAPAYALHQPQQYPRIHPSQSQSNLRLVPQQMMPPVGVAEPGPLSAPPVSPTYNALPRTNAANNAHLLSILNAPGVPRPPPNALPFLNTIGSR